MRIPFKVEKLVTTKLSFQQIIEELENKSSIKYFGGLRVDRYGFTTTDNEFYIQRNSYGVDAFLEYFPLIKGGVVNDEPILIYIQLSPSYLAIGFFFVFAIMFFIAGAFISDWTINGVKRTPAFWERVLIVLFGSGIPLLWCYLQHIRPIGKAEKWVFEKLQLKEIK
jgi:hypothetical protein